MSLWLALRFPRLPLEIYARHQAPHQPLAIAEQQRILMGNSAARQRGIQGGQSLSTARALDPGLRILPRDPQREQTCLEELAQWAGHYTSHVSLHPPHALLLEIGASLAYFHGIDPIVGDFGRIIDELGYKYQQAVAPVPSAALLLARARPGSRVLDKNHLHACLKDIPVQYLELANPRIPEHLRDMGIRRLSDCLSLPRAGLNRRFGKELVQTLDRLLGRQNDPRPAYQTPATFRQNCFLPSETRQTQALLFACQRLLRELEQFLKLRGKGIQDLHIRLFHRKQSVTQFTLSLLKPGQDSRHLLHLLKERLERLSLPAPVEEIQLEAGHLFSLSGERFRQDLFAQTDNEALDWTTLMERLAARLGRDAVSRLACREDHRPEQAWCSGEDGESPSYPTTERPLWLLDPPRPLPCNEARPCWEGPLQLLSSVERIENGWWDTQAVSRDYFVARNPRGSLLWVYRERGRGERWFLHGVFA